MEPENLKYNPSHEWAGVATEQGERVAVVGITAFALKQLTDLVYIALPKVGQKVTAGEEFGEVESVKAVSPLYSPVTGEVVAVHTDLVDRLESLAADPYGDGRIIKVKLAPTDALDGLLSYDQYQQQCAE